MMTRRLRILALAIAWAGAVQTPALADTHGETAHVGVRLIAERDAISPGGTLTLAIRQTIAEGWHTYWKNPGDAGEATHVVWHLPAGFAAGEMAWPAPRRIDVGPLTNYGYEGEAVLLTDIRAPLDLKPGTQVSLAADITWQVCKDICVPEEMRLTLDLPVLADPGPPNPLWANVFAAARDDLPRVLSVGASFTRSGSALMLQINDRAIAAAMHKVALFPLEPGIIVNSAPQSWVAGRAGPLLRLDAGPRFADAGQTPDRFDAVVVAEDRMGQRSTFAVTASRADAAASFDVVSPWAAFALALLGGVLLNLMPCVFPVLSMKVIALARMVAGEARAVHRDGLYYGGGVVLGFSGVGALLLALRHTGAEIGWGFQLQLPAVVTVLTLLFFAIGLNLLGVFTLRLPGAVGVGVGGARTSAFLTGLLAVVVASPCTVPFMAAAVGAAAVLPPAPALLIFAGLGIGMAAPFVVLGFLPRLGTVLPRPGPWMERLKQIMAFAMFASAAWLLWVMSAQTGRAGLAAAFAGVVALGFALWALGERQRGAGMWSRWAWPGALVLAVFCLAAVALARLGPSATDGALAQQPYSAERLATLRGAGRAVFLEATADWCITCKVNERLVLDTAPFALAMKAHDVAYLRADWTRRDSAITRLLADYGRNGVPLYVYFAPGAADGKILPQVLTLNAILGEISTGARTLAAGSQVP